MKRISLTLLAAVLCGPAYAGQAPVGYALFCATHRSECDPAPSATISKDGLPTLTRINAEVNRSIRPQNDTRDVWTLSPRYGDCEDYAITKRHRLIRVGLPAGALRIATVKTSWGEAHAVLIAKTYGGDLVLDNLRPEIVARSRAGYSRWRVATADPKVWE